MRLASAGAGFGDEGVWGRCHSLDRDNCSLMSHRMPSASRADRRAQQGQNAHRCGRAHRLEIPTRPCGLCKEAVLTPLPPTNDDGQMDLQEPGEQETFLAGAGLTACGLRRTAPPAGPALRPGLARVPGAARALRPGPRGPVPAARSLASSPRLSALLALGSLRVGEPASKLETKSSRPHETFPGCVLTAGTARCQRTGQRRPCSHTPRAGGFRQCHVTTEPSSHGPEPQLSPFPPLPAGSPLG